MSTLADVAGELARLLTGQSPDGLAELAFAAPDAPLDPIRLRALDLSQPLGGDVMPRACCALGGTYSPSLGIADVRVGSKHRYRPRGGTAMLADGGITGFVYARRGGFIDLGHVRDYADYTRYFAAKVYHASNQGLTEKLFSEAADLYLVVPQRAARPDPVVAALVGARLAYERAVWHEVITYVPELGTALVADLDQKYSSFAPEDNFSNALGVLVGYRAFITPDTRFDEAVDTELLRALDALGAADKKVTDAATEYVEDHWWESGFPFDGPRPNALRRNLSAFSPITPWLVTAIAVPNREAALRELRTSLGSASPASIRLPEEHRGTALTALARLEFRNPAEPLTALLPASLRARLPDERVVTAAHLPAIVEALRTRIRAEEGVEWDSPGVPVAGGP